MVHYVALWCNFVHYGAFWCIFVVHYGAYGVYGTYGVYGGYGTYGVYGEYGALWNIMVNHQDTRLKAAKASLAHCWACL